MTIVSELRLRARYIIWPTFLTALIFYITFHILQGERGLIAYWQINAEFTAAKKIQQKLYKNKLLLQNKVNLLSPDSLDSDMLEERVRIMLGYTKPNETVILLK